MKYQLEVRANIRQVDDRGQPMYNGSLEVNETKDLGAVSFTEMARVLGKLHDLLAEMTDAENS